jgi:hypothetical protein
MDLVRMEQAILTIALTAFTRMYSSIIIKSMSFHDIAGSNANILQKF